MEGLGLLVEDPDAVRFEDRNATASWIHGAVMSGTDKQHRNRRQEETFFLSFLLSLRMDKQS